VVSQLHLAGTLCDMDKTPLLYVCSSGGSVLTLSPIHHTEPTGLCIHTSITASVKTLMVCCHWPPRATPSIPDEDGVNKKSISLWLWQPAAAGTESRDGVSERTGNTVPVLYLLMRANIMFSGLNWHLIEPGSYRICCFCIVRGPLLARKCGKKWKRDFH